MRAVLTPVSYAGVSDAVHCIIGHTYDKCFYLSVSVDAVTLELNR